MDGHDYNDEKFNRIIKQSEKESISVTLLDIDTIVYKYMESDIVPELEQNGKKLKVPIIYGNSERWKSVQRDGYFKDLDGKIQIPLVMFRRNSIAKNDNFKFLKEEAVTYPTVRKYSKKNAYDRLSLLNPGFNKRYETYDVRMPEYVNLSYEVVIWTSYTEHNNKILEAFHYSADQYWGEKDKFRFRTTIDGFQTNQELAENSERIIKTTFTLVVYAYILPERSGAVLNTLKGNTIRKVVVTNEAVVKVDTPNDFPDVSGERYIGGK